MWMAGCVCGIRGLSPRPAQTLTLLGMGTNAPMTLRSHGLYYFELAAEPGRSVDGDSPRGARRSDSRVTETQNVNRCCRYVIWIPLTPLSLTARPLLTWSRSYVPARSRSIRNRKFTWRFSF